MRQWLAALWMALALSPAPSLVAGTVESVSSDTTWMTVQLAGRRIGHLRIDRVNDGKQVTTTQDLRIEINRNGKTNPMSVLTRSVETLDSQPLGFYSRSMLSTSDSIVDGRRQADGRYAVTTTVAGRASESTLAWPVGALLSDGQRQAMAGAASRSGHYTLSLFDPASQDVATVDIEVLAVARFHDHEVLEQAHPLDAFRELGYRHAGASPHVASLRRPQLRQRDDPALVAGCGRRRRSGDGRGFGKSHRVHGFTPVALEDSGRRGTLIDGFRRRGVSQWC